MGILNIMCSQNQETNKAKNQIPKEPYYEQFNVDKLDKETKCQQPSTTVPELTIIRRLKFYSFFFNFCQI